jgi:hypothetical protein
MTRSRDVANIDGLLTTKGDIYAATAASTPSRLAVGANGQVLTAASTTSTGLAWTTLATPPASGYTLINRTSFSAQTAVTIDSVFSGTYENYFIAYQAVGSSSNQAFYLKYRYGTTTHGSGYNYSWIGTPGNTTIGYVASTGSSAIQLGQLGTGSVNTGALNFYRPDVTDARAYLMGNVISAWSDTFYSGGAFGIASGQKFTGLEISPNSGNITGQISIYGLAK